MALSTHPPQLETARLVLEPLRLDHAAVTFEALRDPELYRFIPVDPPRSLEAMEKRYRRVLGGPFDPAERWWNWIVVERTGGAAVGNVELTIVKNGGRALLAYALHRPFWGRGYAVEACTAALAHARACGVPAFRAFVDTRNARSIALLERLGFVRAETLEAADHFKGAPSDEYRYELGTAT